MSFGCVPEPEMRTTMRLFLSSDVEPYIVHCRAPVWWSWSVGAFKVRVGKPWEAYVPRKSSEFESLCRADL